MELSKLTIDEKDIRPLTIIVGRELGVTTEVLHPGRLVIDRDVAMYHGRRVQKVDLDFPEAWKIVFGKLDAEPEVIRTGGDELVRMLGLIDLSLKMQRLKIPVVWRFPEGNLYPSYQADLADLAQWFVKRFDKGGE